MGIWSDRRYLQRCEQLGRCGIRPSFVEGERIARGFADLGYEEFCMLPSRKMVSLFSGGVSSLDPEHEQFFFLVPTVDDLIDIVAARGIQCASVGFRDARVWEVELREGEKAARAEGRSIEESLIEAVLRCGVPTGEGRSCTR